LGVLHVVGPTIKFAEGLEVSWEIDFNFNLCLTLGVKISVHGVFVLRSYLLGAYNVFNILLQFTSSHSLEEADVLNDVIVQLVVELFVQIARHQRV
jgi:hypothetical protein